LVTKVEVAGGGVGVTGGVGVVGVVGAGVVGRGVVGAGVLTAGTGDVAAGAALVEELVLSESLESQPLITEKERIDTNPAIAVHALTLFVIATCSHCCANHTDSKRLSTRLEFTQTALR
jgi:hypothetical protein